MLLGSFVGINRKISEQKGIVEEVRLNILLHFEVIRIKNSLVPEENVERPME